MFVDLIAAYDTVWHRGLICKLLRLISDRHIAKFIMKLLRNHSFIVTTGTDPKSRLKRLRNSVPQGSVLAPLLFNACAYDLHTTTSKKFAYACRRSSNYALRKGLEGVRGSSIPRHGNSVDVSQKWKLKLSGIKTVSAAFHLNNREATRELNVTVEDQNIPPYAEPTHLGVKMDSTLTFQRHLESLRLKLTSRVELLRRLAGSSWGAATKALRTAT